jgi:hypothetical protein
MKYREPMWAASRQVPRDNSRQPVAGFSVPTPARQATSFFEGHRMNSRTRERAIAAEIADELHRVLGPILPQDLAGKNGDIVRGVFGDAFDRHGIINETVAARILARVPKVLARMNLQFAELNRQLAVAARPRFTEATRGPV